MFGCKPSLAVESSEFREVAAHPQHGAEPKDPHFLVNTLDLSLDARGVDGGYMLLLGHCSGSTYPRRRLRWTEAN